MKTLRNILLIALLQVIVVSCKAQFRTLDWGTAEDTTTLKAYAGGARGMFVYEDSSLYVLCFPCSLSAGEVLQGVGTRKWLKIPKGSGGSLSSENDPVANPRIDSLIANWPSSTPYVDSIWRVAGKDSIYYSKNGNTYQIKDSTGSVSTRDRFGYPGEDVTAGENRTFNFGSLYKFDLSGSRAGYLWGASNSSSSSTAGALYGTLSNGDAVFGQATGSGNGVRGASSSGNGVWGRSTSGFGVSAWSDAGKALYARSQYTSTNDVQTVMDVHRTTSGTAAAGIGGAINFLLKNESGSNPVFARIVAKGTDVTGSAESGQLELWTTIGGTSAVRLIITDIPTYADDTAAGAAGLVTGTMYKTSAGVLMIKL